MGHLRPQEHAVEEELLLVAVGEVRDDLTFSLVEDGHGPLCAVGGRRRQELHVHLDDLERLEAEHSLDFGLYDLACLAAWLRGLLLPAERVRGAAVGLGADELEGAIDVEIKGQVGLRVVGEGELLDLLGGSLLVGHGPVPQPHVVLAVHLELSVDR